MKAGDDSPTIASPTSLGIGRGDIYLVVTARHVAGASMADILDQHRRTVSERSTVRFTPERRCHPIGDNSISHQRGTIKDVEVSVPCLNAAGAGALERCYYCPRACRVYQRRIRRSSNFRFLA